jgi:D-alanyl-D-alanine carboxypeptidase
MGKKVMVATPGFWNPFMDAGELEVLGKDKARIALANGYASHGESARLVRGRGGKASELWLGGGKLLPEEKAAAEAAKRYDGGAGARVKRKRA